MDAGDKKNTAGGSWVAGRNGNPQEVAIVKILKNKIVYETEINGLKGKANMIVYPESLEELKYIVRTYKDIIPRGYGTSFTGAVHPNNSVIVDLSKNNRILEVNLNKKLVYAETGITLRELNEQLSDYGLEFPVETIFSGVETLGGVIAKNSPGARELKYGRAMTWVDSLEIINSSGELEKIRKSDLSEHVGMEGTSGIILRATLRLTQLKSRSISILKSDNLANIFDANKKLRLQQEVCSVDLINKQISALLGLENKYHLFVEFEGDKGNFKDKEYRKFCKLKSKSYCKIAGEGYSMIENIKSFSDSIEEIITFLEENKIPFFSNFASGFFYCFFKPEEKTKRKQLLDFAKKLRTKISYNFGIGLTKKEYLELGERKIISRVKARIDKNLKFNDNKLIDSLKNKDSKIKDQDSEETQEISEEKPVELELEPELELKSEPELESEAEQKAHIELPNAIETEIRVEEKDTAESESEKESEVNIEEQDEIDFEAESEADSEIKPEPDSQDNEIKPEAQEEEGLGEKT